VTPRKDEQVPRLVRLCVLGFGGTARRLFELMVEHRTDLAARYGIEFAVTGVGTGRHGSWCDPAGVPPTTILQWTSDADWSFPDPHRRGEELVAASQADVLVEATPLEPGGEPAIAHVRAGLEHDMDVVTVNKGPVAWGYRRLTGLARDRGRNLRFEGTVMDGCPVFSLVEKTLPAVTVLGFAGVLNSTSNVVLDRLAEGGALADAVGDAQEQGFAEADPSHDLSGYDTAVKVAILANVWLGADLDPDAIARTGVDASLADRVRAAHLAGRRVRLLGSGSRRDDHVDASVDLVEVEPSSPFFATSGASSTLQVFTDLAGVIEITERAPGLTQTAYAVLADLLHCAAIR